MSLLNLSLNLVAYADDGKTTNPFVKFSDLSWSMLGLPTGTPRMVPIALAPGESKVIMSTARSISYNAGTPFNFTQVTGTSYVRLYAMLGQRITRNAGDITTEWDVTVTNQISRLTYTTNGTAPTFGSISPGDGLTLGSPFAIQNQGTFTIVRVGANFIEFENPFAAPETVTGVANVYSSGPVQVGDILDITDPVVSFPNRGAFKILNVTDTYIEFSNPEAIPETVLGLSPSTVVVYPEAYNWMLLALDRRAVVRCNGDTGLGVEVEPPTEGDIVKYPGLLLKRGKLFELELYNPGLNLANGFVFLAE